jgi:hypothetical protein
VLLVWEYGLACEAFQGGKRRRKPGHAIDEAWGLFLHETQMNIAAITANHDAADQKIELAQYEIDMIRYDRFSNAQGCPSFADLGDQAPMELCLSHPLCRKEQIAEERDLSPIPFSAEVI